MNPIVLQDDRYKIVTDITNENGVRELVVQSLLEPIVCSECLSDEINKRTMEKRTIFDVHEKQVVHLKLERQSYRCKTCGKTFFADKDPYPEKMHITSEFSGFIAQRFLQEHNETLKTIGSRYGVSTATVSNALKGYINGFDDRVYSVKYCDTLIFYPFEYEHAERCMVCGIDEDGDNLILGILDDYTTEAIKSFVSDKIKYNDDISLQVFCDLNEDVIECLYDVFPCAIIAVNRAILRRRLNKLSTDISDELLNAKGLAIDALEDILKSSSDDKLNEHLENWFAELHPQLQNAFRDIIDEVVACSGECKNGFEFRYEDGKINSINKLIKIFKNKKTSYEAFKLRMLITDVAIKNQIKNSPYGNYMNIAICSDEQKHKDYCVDVDTLLHIYCKD